MSIITDKIFLDPKKCQAFIDWLDSKPRLDIIYMPGARAYSCRIVSGDSIGGSKPFNSYRSFGSFLGALWTFFEEEANKTEPSP